MSGTTTGADSRLTRPDIRLGSPRDLESILPLAEEAYMESSPSLWGEFSEGKCREYLLKYLTMPSNEACCLGLWKQQKLVGFLLGSRAQGTLQEEYVAVEHHWYVTRSHRSKDSIELLSAFEQWASLVGCSALIVSAPRKALERYLSRRGYSYETSIMRKELHGR